MKIVLLSVVLLLSIGSSLGEIANCLAVKATPEGEEECEQCNLDYHINFEKTCTKNPEGCGTYDLQIGCVDCITGYHIEDKICAKCSDHCIDCEFKKKCRKCEDNYTIDDEDGTCKAASFWGAHSLLVSAVAVVTVLICGLCIYFNVRSEKEEDGYIKSTGSFQNTNLVE